MIHVEISDKDLWHYYFTYQMMDIFFQKNEEKRSKMMFNFFGKLFDEKSEELSKHFKKFYPGRYMDSPEGIELREAIEKRHDDALSEAIKKFPDEFWTAVIADMIMWSKQEGKIIDAKKIVHEIIVPMYSGTKDPDEFKQRILKYLEIRLHTFSENEKENLKSEAGF